MVTIGEVLTRQGWIPPADGRDVDTGGSDDEAETLMILVLLSDEDRARASGYPYEDEWVEVRLTHRSAAIATGVVLDTPRHATAVRAGDRVQAIQATPGGRWMYTRTLERAAWAPEAAWVQHDAPDACWLCGVSGGAPFVVGETITVHACPEHVPAGAQPYEVDW